MAKRERHNPQIVNIPRQNITQWWNFPPSFLMQVSHLSKCRGDTNPASLQAHNAILCGIKREHNYLSPSHPLCPLSAH